MHLGTYYSCSWDSHSKNTGVICHGLLQGTKFCQNSPLWPIHLRWPCIAWFIASLSYTSPFTMTRLWYSWEGLVLKLKLQYFGHLMWRVDSLERLWYWERLEAGGEENDKRWDGCMASLTWCTWVWVNSGSWWRTGRPGMLRFMRSQRVRHDWATELNWTLF